MASSHTKVTDHFVSINSLNIHYRDWGDLHLPPLMILHGGGNSISRTWDHVAAALADRLWRQRFPLKKSANPRQHGAHWRGMLMPVLCFQSGT